MMVMVMTTILMIYDIHHYCDENDHVVIMMTIGDNDGHVVMIMNVLSEESEQRVVSEAKTFFPQT